CHPVVVLGHMRLADRDDVGALRGDPHRRTVGVGCDEAAVQERHELAPAGLDRGILHVDSFVGAFRKHVRADVVRTGARATTHLHDVDAAPALADVVLYRIEMEQSGVRVLAEPLGARCPSSGWAPTLWATRIPTY